MECEKIAYPDLKQAVEAVKALTHRKKDKYKYYKCKDCGKFHIATARRKGLNRSWKFKATDEDKVWKQPEQKLVVKLPKPLVEKPLRPLQGYATEKVFASLLKLKT